MKFFFKKSYNIDEIKKFKLKKKVKKLEISSKGISKSPSERGVAAAKSAEQS